MADADHSNEIWKDIPGYEGFYQASSEGRIKSLARRSSGTDVLGRRWARSYPSKVMAQHKVGIGYKVVCLTVEGISTNEYVHRLVCSAFNGAPAEGRGCAAHWDGDPGNNLPANLRWASYQENTLDKHRHQRMRSRAAFRNVKITPQDADRMAFLRSCGLANKEIASAFGCSASTVQKYIEAHSSYVRITR